MRALQEEYEASLPEDIKDKVQAVLQREVVSSYRECGFAYWCEGCAVLTVHTYLSADANRHV